MKQLTSITLLTLSALILTGCNSSDTATTTGESDSPYTISAKFAEQFKRCESDPTSCDLNRDAVIQGTITKIYEENIWDFSNFVDVLNADWSTSSIPVLPDTQQKRSTIIVSPSGDLVAFEDIKVWDQIKASVKSFDIVEGGQVAEKLWQYGYIQVTAQ